MFTLELQSEHCSLWQTESCLQCLLEVTLWCYLSLQADVLIPKPSKKTDFPEKSLAIYLKDTSSLWSVRMSVCLQMKYNHTPLRHLSLCVCVCICVCDGIRYATKANSSWSCACANRWKKIFYKDNYVTWIYCICVCRVVLPDKIRYTSKTILALGVIVCVWVCWQQKNPVKPQRQQ